MQGLMAELGRFALKHTEDAGIKRPDRADAAEGERS
jgi:hypothetical protein